MRQYLNTARLGWIFMLIDMFFVFFFFFVSFRHVSIRVRPSSYVKCALQSCPMASPNLIGRIWSLSVWKSVNVSTEIVINYIMCLEFVADNSLDLLRLFEVEMIFGSKLARKFLARKLLSLNSYLVVANIFGLKLPS